MRLLVTGASGLVGRRSTDRFRNSVDELVGTDITLPQSNTYPFYPGDIRKLNIADIISQHKIDTIVHLAWILMTSRDKKLEYETNILGTKNILEAAERTRVKRVLFTSTCAVHGVSKKRIEHPYTEASPFDEKDKLPYVKHKIWAEKELQAFQARTGIPVCILRPAAILGPNTDNVISRSISDLNPLPIIRGYNPRRQFVHEDDVVEALYQAIIKNAQGVFHVSPDDAVLQSELYDLVKTEKIELPHFFAKLALKHQYKTGKLETPPEMMKYIMYELLTDNSKMRAQLCTPQYTTQQAFESFIRAKAIAK